MILELVLFKSPPGMDRAAVLEDAKHTIPRWRANPDLLRKHYLLSEDGYGGGVYTWPSKAAAQKGHDAAWRGNGGRGTRARPGHPHLAPPMVVGNENDNAPGGTPGGAAAAGGRRGLFR